MNQNRKKAGFTLAETLITMLILLMVTGIVAAGMPVAVNAYNRVVDAANAQILLATTVTRLREELGTATVVYTQGGKLVNYSNGDKGFTSALLNSEDLTEAEREKLTNPKANGIMIRYTPDNKNGAAIGAVDVTTGKPADINYVLLVPELKLTNKRTPDGKIYAEYLSDITYSDGVFTITGLTVKKMVKAADGNEAFQETGTKLKDPLVIRAIMKPTEITH